MSMSDPHSSGETGGALARTARLAPPAVGLLLGLALLAAGATGLDDTNLEDAALGKGTHSVFWRFSDGPVHCRDLRDDESCFDAADAADARSGTHGPRVLWFGNSQLHAVNQGNDSSMTAPALLNRALDREGVRVVTLSQPNATLAEHYLLFESVKTQYRPDVLLLPVVFDDTREGDVRADVARALDAPSVRASVEATAAGQAVVGSLTERGDDYAALDATVQDRSEHAVNAWLDNNSSIWAARPKLRGRMLLGLRQMRNSAFGIRPDSKRRAIVGPYRLNVDGYEALLASAADAGVQVIVYVAPLRNDIPVPYVAREYTAFKTETEAIARRHGARFINIEGLVPGELWGAKRATTVGETLELDFMHFQEGGHRLLADTLASVVRDVLRRAAGTPSPR